MTETADKFCYLTLAPIRGFTNALYRNLLFRHAEGLDAAVTPFIATLSAKQINRSHIKDILPEHNGRVPVIPQIIGNDPEGFIRLTTRFHDLGYDTVNWNLGCPFPVVANKRRGSGMLPYPDLIRAFLDEVIPRIPTRLSIKTRIGRKEKDEIFHLLPIFNEYPIEELIIHPRTGIQMYDGTVDLDTFARCLPLLNMPVAYNGDIFDLDSFKRLKERFKGITRWMIGRGVLSNPFLPEILRSGKAPARYPMERFKKFHEDLFEAYREELSGPAHLLDKMKGYWMYFSRSFMNGEALFKKIKKTNSIGKFEELVERLFHHKS